VYLKILKITPIKSETDYDNALKRLDVIFNAPIGSPEGDEAEVGMIRKLIKRLNLSPGLMINDYKLSQ